MRKLAVLVLFLGGGWSPARAQGIAPKGAAETLDVATWNLEWFGSVENGPADERLQLENIRRVIEASGTDLWAVQEIDDEAWFDSLLAALGPAYGGALGTASTNFRMGFIYRADVVRPIRVSDVWLYAFRDAFARRPPVLMEADVALGDALVTLFFVTLHMKCCSDGYEQRREASERLKAKIDESHPHDPFVVLGDFNDELGTSISGTRVSPYANFSSAADRYAFIGIHEGLGPTWCENASCSDGSVLDHILITDELFAAYLEGSIRRHEQLLSEVDDYVRSTSDHLPVHASFSFSRVATVRRVAHLEFAVEALYPNPTTSTVMLTYSLVAPERVLVDIIDVLGREVRVAFEGFRAAGEHQLRISTVELADGIYFLRLRTGAGTAVRRLVVAR